MLSLLIALIASVTSFVSGMLGLGGAVLLIPAYLYIPGLFDLEPLSVKEISGLTSVQVLSASVFSLLVHQKRGVVDSRLVLVMGIPITVCALLGAFASQWIEPKIILAAFASMAILGSAMVFLRKENNSEVEGRKFTYNTIAAVIIAVLVGFFGGMVGAPGAFLLSPLMMTVLKIPTRITIGSTLGIVVLSALAASVGKFATGQVPLAETMVAVAASIPGAYLGSRFSHVLKTKTLRNALAVLIALVAIQMWLRILS